MDQVYDETASRGSGFTRGLIYYQPNHSFEQRHCVETWDSIGGLDPFLIHGTDGPKACFYLTFESTTSWIGFCTNIAKRKAAKTPTCRLQNTMFHDTF